MNSTFPRASLFGTRECSVSSTIRGRDYRVLVQLPDSYSESDQSYPVVYLLDGDIAFGLMLGPAFEAAYFFREAPECILVGIGNNPDSLAEWFDLRQYDFFPGEYKAVVQNGCAAQFLAFIKQELIPFVETNYRCKANTRILFGYSYGGFFVLWAWQQEPTLFRHYLAGSPLNRESFRFLSDRLDRIEPKRFAASSVHLAIGVGSLEPEMPYAMAYARDIKDRKWPGLTLSSFTMDGCRHSSVGQVQFFMQSMKAAFAGAG